MLTKVITTVAITQAVLTKAYVSSDLSKFLGKEHEHVEAIADPADHWAVIVVGSKEFWNYRH